MYSVYLNNGDGEILLYSPDTTYDGYIIISPKISQTINKAASFTFSITALNPNLSSLHLLSTIVTVRTGTADSDIVFRGRIRRMYLADDGICQVFCEESMAYLNDSIFYWEIAASAARPYYIMLQIMAQYVGGYYTSGAHQGEPKYRHAGAQRDIKIGTYKTAENETPENRNEVEPETDLLATNDYNTTCLDKIFELNTMFALYSVMRYSGSENYLDTFPIQTEPDEGAQEILFGENVISYELNRATDNVVTRIFPIGSEGLTLEGYMGYSVDDEYIPVEDTQVGAGVGKVVEPAPGSGDPEDIYKTQVYRVVKFDYIQHKDDLFKAAVDYLKANTQSTITVKVKAIDLNIVDPSVSKLQIGHAYRVRIPLINVDDPFVCSSITRYLDAPENDTYEFGSAYKSLTTSVQYSQNIVHRR